MQAADRVFGPWLCRQVTPRARAVLNIKRGAPIPASELRNILVIRPGGLGDATLTLPMLQALSEHYPDAAVDVLAERRNAEIYAMVDLTGNIYCYDINSARTYLRLKRKAYDLVIDTEQYHALSAAFANALRPRYLCGFGTLDRNRLQTHSAPLEETTYEAVSFLRLAETITGRSLPFEADQAFVPVNQAAQDWAASLCKAFGLAEIVTITPSAGSPYRLWPVSRYAEVARWLIRRGYIVVLVGGPDGIDAANQIAAANREKCVLNLAGKTTLAQTAALLQRARLSVSADTGVMHMAYGVGTPTVALFGPGLHRKWAPRGKYHRTVRRDLPCSPCTRNGRIPPCPHRIACMTEMSATGVMRAISALLADPSVSNRVNRPGLCRDGEIR